MKRLVWLLLAAFGTALAPVVPLAAAPVPVATMSCCGATGKCGTHDAMPCTDQAAKDCPACLPCSANCCLAVLTAADSLPLPLQAVARVDHAAQKGLYRADPPPLPPPRRLA